MPRVLYTPKNFGAASLDVIHQANAICTEYRAQGFDLTLRQLYYQFVSRGLIPNNDREYKRLGSIVNDARLAGKLDWEFIIDRTRDLESVAHYDSPQDILDIAARAHRIDKWSTQPTRVEVWIEKDALVGVIEGVCQTNDVSFFSCRGYVSQSEMWVAAQRIGAYIEAGQNVVLLHLGDHDPSGIDMTRDISARIDNFITQDFLNAHEDLFGDDPRVKVSEIRDNMAAHCGAWSRGEPAFEVRRIALTMGQVEEYQPPPNPAKLTDVRARKYIEEYGDESWELDALDPATLYALIDEHVTGIRDDEAWEAQVEQEESERERLRRLAQHYSEIVLPEEAA